MKIPRSWLRDFVESALAPEDLAHRLTMAGLEAEKIEHVGSDWAKIYVGSVQRVERHPNADRLVLAEIDAGEHRLTVVTGAPNIAPGQKVALALAGARLIDGHAEGRQYTTLKPGVIRGIRSEGIVCSEKELGLSEEHAGILVLEPEAPVGQPLSAWLGDTVIEFEITPNLVHAFSVLGIAREAAALTGAPLNAPPTADLSPAGNEVLVRVDAPDLCRRYAGVVIEGVNVGPSPAWLTRRLTAAGLRPVNNIVDITNYVMLEWGQPLHAFDHTRLREGRIVVRRAAPGETIETLDHQGRELSSDMLVIADAERAVAIAGVMGGVDSEVDDATTTILLESANFDMKSVRRTARTLKLRTDASARFERGLDPNLVVDAAARATRLILDLCPGSRVTEVRDVYPVPVLPSDLTLPFTEIERLLGVRYEAATVLDVLTRLGFAPALHGEGDRATLRVTVPTYRQDVTLPADVVEEVARVVGYEALPETLPAGRAVPIRRDPMHRLQAAARGVLTAAGFDETITYVTVSEAMLGALAPAEGAAGFVHQAPLADLLRLRNPLQSDRALLRPTLLPALAEIAASNLKHEPGVRLFELARVYLPRGRDTLPREPSVAALVTAGRREPVSRFGTEGEMDFFDLKGALEALLSGLGVRDPRFEQTQHAALHPGRAAALCVGDQRLALLGELRPDIADRLDLGVRRVAVAEIDLDALLNHLNRTPAEVRVPRFLPVQQDFAVVVAEETPAADVERALQAGAGALATGISLFDIYRGPQLGEGRKSLAYRVTFTAPDRALTDTELDKVRGRIAKVLAQRVDGALRA